MLPVLTDRHGKDDDSTSLLCGKATVIGTFVGALLIGTINNGLIIMGLDVSEQMMIAGGLIILAVAFGRRPTKT